MIKVEVIENFTLGKFDELKNITRKSAGQYGYLFTGDTFECTEEMAKYLTNEAQNPKNRPFVRVIEVIPEKITKVEKKIVEEKKTKTTKTTKKKS